MNNLYVFHGADRKTGVTMISQSVSECLANMLLSEDILYITLNGRSNSQFIKGQIKTVDDYKSKVQSGIHVSKNEISRLGNMNNLYVISGIREETEERLYMPGFARSLLKDVEPEFGIIIADCGSEIDNGLAIGAFAETENTFMVLSQNEATLRRYEKTRKLYNELKINFDSVIVNKFSEKDPYTRSYIKKRLEINEGDFFTVGMTTLGRQAEMEYRTFADLRDSMFVRDIEQIVDKIIRTSGKKVSGEKRKSKWKGFI